MITHYHHDDAGLWSAIGKYFASAELRKELGGPMSSNDNYHWFVSSHKGEINGFAALEIKKSGVWFRHSYVFESSRNNGVYGELLKARMNFCQQQGVDIVPMITCVATGDSLPSLQKIGFKVISERGKYTTLRLKM